MEHLRFDIDVCHFVYDIVDIDTIEHVQNGFLISKMLKKTRTLIHLLFVSTYPWCIIKKDKNGPIQTSYQSTCVIWCLKRLAFS